MNCTTTKLFGLLQYFQHKTFVKKVISIAFVCLKLMYVKIWKNLQILTSFSSFFSIFGLKIRVFDEVYDYLIIYSAVVFPAQSLLHGEISKKCFKIKELSLFPNFVVKVKVFELAYDCLILYFPVSIPSIENIQKISVSWHKCIKSYCLKKIEKISLRP